MPEIRKVTVGWVTQRWDADTGKFLGQEFTAGDEVSYEDEDGEMTHLREPEYRCFEMVQDPRTVEIYKDGQHRSSSQS